MTNFMDMEFESSVNKANTTSGNLAPFPAILAHGNDQDLPLDPVLGHNLNFIEPLTYEEQKGDTVIRSACNFSPPTWNGYQAAKSAYEKLANGETTTDQVMQGIRDELMRIYELP